MKLAPGVGRGVFVANRIIGRVRGELDLCRWQFEVLLLGMDPVNALEFEEFVGAVAFLNALGNGCRRRPGSTRWLPPRNTGSSRVRARGLRRNLGLRGQSCGAG